MYVLPLTPVTTRILSGSLPASVRSTYGGYGEPKGKLTNSPVAFHCTQRPQGGGGWAAAAVGSSAGQRHRQMPAGDHKAPCNQPRLKKARTCVIVADALRQRNASSSALVSVRPSIPNCSASQGCRF